jgi:hypothetical protein
MPARKAHERFRAETSLAPCRNRQRKAIFHVLAMLDYTSLWHGVLPVMGLALIVIANALCLLRTRPGLGSELSLTLVRLMRETEPACAAWFRASRWRR